jgi:hypothetical protein
MQVRATAADRHTMSPVYTPAGDPYDGDAKKGLWGSTARFQEHAHLQVAQRP